MVQVVPGAQAWSHDGGEVGVLLLHGFTSNPLSLRPLADDLAKRGFSVELPRLPGHGTRWQDCQRTGWSDWMRETLAAYEQLRARTTRRVVAGLSMGGALALDLAQRRGEDLSGLALLNPTIQCDSLLQRWLPQISRVLPSSSGLGNDIARPGGDEKPYPRTPLRAGASIVRNRERIRARLHEITVPVLVLTSRQDHVVHPDNSAIVLQGVSSADRRHVWLERSYHVAILDYDAQVVCDEVAGFARRVTAGAPHR